MTTSEFTALFTKAQQWCKKCNPTTDEARQDYGAVKRALGGLPLFGDEKRRLEKLGFGALGDY
jgi:hypothetical protein